MNEATDWQRWVQYAEDDYTAARSLLRRRRPLTAIACFHAQQCAEKYLKAALVSQGCDFPKTHDLSALNMLCEQAGILPGIGPTQLGVLSAYAVQARYPGDSPTLEEAQVALQIAQAVRRFVRRFLGIR